MPKQNSFLSYVLEYLQPHGPITARAMFGGYGIYWHKVIFAVIVQDQLYFRVDTSNREDFESYQSEPFVYNGSGKNVIMPYSTLPEEILLNAEELALWIEKAYNASLRYREKKSKKGTPSKN